MSRDMRRASRETTGAQRALTTPAATDSMLVMAAALLVGLGLVLVYSASSVYAARVFDNAEHFLTLQAAWVVVGLVVLVLVGRVPRAWLSERAGWLLLVAVVLCAVVLVPGVGTFRGGARRWLALGPLGFQPSELAKLAVVVMLAAVLSRRDNKPAKEQGSLWVPVLLAQIPVALILAEPDLGTALVIELILAAMVFVAGVRMRTLMLLGLAGLPVLYHLVMGTPFRLRRILSYVDPWAYRSTVGYQATEALISIGSGGVTGVGLGQGMHRLFFLPEAHTDFIFAILAQDLGLLGVLVLLGAFAVLLWRAGRLAWWAVDDFDRYLAVGLTALIGIPAVFNVGVVTGLLPTKGLPLPLVSYGGSNLVVTLAALGALLRIGRDGVRQPSEAKA